MTHNEFAEKLNGRLAMLGVIAALGSLRRHRPNYPRPMVIYILAGLLGSTQGQL